MRRALAFALLLGFGACAADPPGPSAAACHVRPRAELPLASTRNFLLAPASLNGNAVLLVVDTGAEVTTLTPEAAAALRLPRDPRHGSVFLGVSGPMRTENVQVSRFAIGPVQRADQSFGLGAMPPFPGTPRPVAGLLGADLLASYEVELDLPHGRMGLYPAGACGGAPPWPATATLPITRTRSGLAFVDAVVDGHRVRALLDTGARTTLLARATAITLGITPEDLAADPERRATGIGNHGIAIRQHRFAELGLPGAMWRNVTVNVADLHLPGVEMLLGADYLGPRRVWISYATGRLFLQ